MSTAFHVSTYLQMGDDFDSRNRFLRQPADGIYEGYIVAGETWSFNWANFSGRNRPIVLQFKMGGYVFTAARSTAVSPITPSGISIGITSE
jgi:hypothetical protein